MGRQWWTSCRLGASRAVETGESHIRCEGYLGRPFSNCTTFAKSTVLGGLAFVAGTTTAGAELLKRWLRHWVIEGKRVRGGWFARTITVAGGDELRVIDEGVIPGGANNVVVGGRLDTIYGESSRYFVPSQLSNTGDELDVDSIAVTQGRYRIERSFKVEPDGTLLTRIACGRVE